MYRNRWNIRHLYFIIISFPRNSHSTFYIIEFVHQSPALWLTDNIRGSAHENIGKELVQWSIAKEWRIRWYWRMLRAIGRQQKGWCWTQLVIVFAIGAGPGTPEFSMHRGRTCWSYFLVPVYRKKWMGILAPQKLHLCNLSPHRGSQPMVAGPRWSHWELSRQDSYKSRFETMGLSSEPGRSGDGWRSCRITPFWMGSLMEWQWSLG